MQNELNFILQVSDVECEQLLLNRPANESSSTSLRSQHNSSWRELSFLSACLSAKDICILSASDLTPDAVKAAVVNRFTNRHYHFHSNEHFVQVKAEVIQHMQSFFASKQHESELMARFETFSVSIDELDMELTQHFHMMYYEPSSNCYIVQRLMSDPNEALLELYYHTTAIFAAKAFNDVALRFEVLYPLCGKVMKWQHNSQEIQPSLDYMTILRTLLLDSKNNTTLLI